MNINSNRAEAAQANGDAMGDAATNPKERQTEAEFLEHQAQLAREALQRVRGEVLQSIAHSADIRAWGQRYPWPTMGAAAAAGLGTGWALGSILAGKKHPAEAPVAAAAPAQRPSRPPQSLPPWGRQPAASFLAAWAPWWAPSRRPQLARPPRR